jgi:hypothetical protein
VSSVLATLAVSACTGVPTSSAPQTVEQLPAGAQPSSQAIRPPKDAPPRQIVSEFLRANAVDPGKHTSARAFLSPAARNRWSDDTATIITDEVLGTYDPETKTLTVYGRQFGKLDKFGIYTPTLEGDGTGGARVEFQYRLVTINGQYRIDQLRPGGLLLTDTQFAQSYKQHSLYFYDDAEKYFVQDPRYTDIDDRTQLSQWLLSQLATGPRPDLQNAVAADTLPAQSDVSRMLVDVRDVPNKIEIPGSRQLDAAGRRRLAAQLAETLDEPLAGATMELTDAGRPVPIPSLGGSRFDPSDFAATLGPAAPPREVYYLTDGHIRTEDGAPLAGPLARATSQLSSIALSRPSPAGPLLIAGVQGTGSQATLLVGTQELGLRPTTVRGDLTRPAFGRGRRELWIGDGTRIFCLSLTLGSGGVSAKVVTVPLAGVSDGTRVKSVRLSPDGARVAVVVTGEKESGGQLYIGSVVRGAGQVRIDSLQLISPQQAVVTDVAWLNPLRLFAIGRLTTSSDSLTFDTGVDGTDWTTRVVGLSSAPDWVTVTGGATAWVSAGGFVWVQSAGQWVSPSGGQTLGTAPVYLE